MNFSGYVEMVERSFTKKKIMKKILLLVLVALSQLVQAQGLYEINTLREITIKFYELNTAIYKTISQE